eukprot:2988112-Amphidinium_carterae.1
MSNAVPPFSQEEKEKVRLGTLYVLKTFLLCEAAAKTGAGFAIENPAPRTQGPSIFRLSEYKRLAEQYGVQLLTTHQCQFGAETTKPTAIAWYPGVAPPQWQ